jgi:hypothetical protein
MKNNAVASLRKSISQVIISHIQNRYGNNLVYANNILTAIKRILFLKLNEYDLPQHIIVNGHNTEVDKDDFQESLSKINEKEARRKKEGVYYTDRDVTDFLVSNTLLHYVQSSQKKVYGFNKTIKKLDSLRNEEKKKIIDATAFDPTCGTGEFLLSILSIKIHLLKQIEGIRCEGLAKSIFGNDIEVQSTEITKLRLFFLLVDSFENSLDVDEIADCLNNNFTNVDAVVYDKVTFGHKDIVIGNPPYVEYRNYEGSPEFEYGNVYADVLHHSVDTLTEYGIMAFVIPLSYVSTIRMSLIRGYISENTDKQIVMNFADRPDCLFSCVHQKLTIIIAQKQSDYKGVLSSSYNYWYQSERESLFDNISLAQTNISNIAYWPKIGNKIETSLYNKFLKLQGRDILSLDKTCAMSDLYINQRGCFWMKAFTRDMHSNSYSNYPIPKDIHPFIYCLVNSSLFFLLWVIISDGWHITNKELSFVKIPLNLGDCSVWQNLMDRLENKLELTKVYVGTKQVEYEYKHKECKDIIDEIDNEIAKVYKLSDTQLKYIKGFGLKYRLGDGA